MCEKKIIDKKNLIVGEGPIWDDVRERLYFIDFMGHEIRCHDLESGLTESITLDFDPGCIALTLDGDFVAAAEKDIRLVRMDGTCEVISKDFEFKGARFNDGKAGPDGRFYVGSKGKPGEAAFYRMDHDGSMHMLFDGVGLSNGLGWNPDCTVMYYCDTRSKLLEAFDFDAENGSVSNRRTILPLPLEEGQFDGLTVDENGHVWVAVWNGYCLLRVDPEQGKVVEKIDFPAAKVSSCAFAGHDLDHLIVTTASYQTKLEEQPLAGCTFDLLPQVRGLTGFRVKLDL